MPVIISDLKQGYDAEFRACSVDTPNLLSMHLEYFCSELFANTELRFACVLYRAPLYMHTMTPVLKTKIGQDYVYCRRVSKKKIP